MTSVRTSRSRTCHVQERQGTSSARHSADDGHEVGRQNHFRSGRCVPCITVPAISEALMSTARPLPLPPTRGHVNLFR